MDFYQTVLCLNFSLHGFGVFGAKIENVSDFDAARLNGIIVNRRIGGLVLGLPRNMDGSEGPRVQSTRAFARNLAQKVDVPIVFWDERLSTSAVTRTLIEADVRRDRRAQVVDKLAASYILQGALDRLRP